MTNKLQRREFNKIFIRVPFIAMAASYCYTKVNAKDGPNKLVDPKKNSTAAALNYVHDASQSKNRKDTSQSCKNCQFFRKESDDIQLGNCQLIPNGLVKASGWCESWAAIKNKKP